MKHQALSEYMRSRRQAILGIYQSIKPAVQFVAKHLHHKDGRLLDVGTGEGIIALEVAQEFGASEVIFADVEDFLLVELPSNAKFQIIDVCSRDFLSKFQNKVTAVTCFKAFHEFEDPFQAAVNLISILPHNGILFLLDLTEKGWEHMEQINHEQGGGALLHHKDDLERIRSKGLKLNTDQGIKDFWEGLFPRIPGKCNLQFIGEMYSVIYVAKQWGEVKPFPG